MRSFSTLRVHLRNGSQNEEFCDIVQGTDTLQAEEICQGFFESDRRRNANVIDRVSGGRELISGATFSV